MRTDNWICMQKDSAHKKQRSSDWTDLPELLLWRIERLLVDHLARIVPKSVAVADAQLWPWWSALHQGPTRISLCSARRSAIRHIYECLEYAVQLYGWKSRTLNKSYRASGIVHPFVKSIHRYVIKAYGIGLEVGFGKPYVPFKWSAHRIGCFGC